MVTLSCHCQEFEIIAQIKLLQEAAKNYVIVPDEKFRHWFDNIKTFSEAERWAQISDTSFCPLCIIIHPSPSVVTYFVNWVSDYS